MMYPIFQRQKPPGYFRTLHDILKVLINFFYGDRIPQDETLMKMKALLQLYAADSSELISRYLWERHLEQVRELANWRAILGEHPVFTCGRQVYMPSLLLFFFFSQSSNDLIRPLHKSEQERGREKGRPLHKRAHREEGELRPDQVLTHALK